MNGELNFDDILIFPEIIEIKRINQYFLVISVETANWIVLSDSYQLDFLNQLRQGVCIGDIAEAIDTEEHFKEFQALLAALFARKFAGVDQLPQKEYLEGYKMLNIYVTNACNLRCKHCFMNSGTRLKNELPVDEWIKILTEFRENGGETVTFSGGEPLMNKGLPQMVKHAHGVGLKVTILSNGILWTEQLIKSLAPFIDEIQFSIDGVNEQTNAVVRGKGNFQKVVETVVCFANSGVKTSVATTFTYENLEDDTHLKYKALREAIIDRTQSDVFFKLSKKLLPGREVHISAEANELYAKRIKEIEQFIDKNADYENFMVGHSPNLIALNCGLGGISISADGYVYFCNRIAEVENYGHVFDHPLSFYMTKGREIHKETSVDNVEPCATCELRYICDGGCRIDDFDFHGRLKNATKPFKQISCTEEKKRNLMQRMIDSYNYFYDFEE